MDYVNRNLVGDLSLDAISGKCGISRYYLCRMFKKETGSTLHNYILFKRVSEAKRLLAAGLKVAQASELCGFGSVIRLSAAFSKVVGKTPGAYAKELRRS
jgi:AraC-like DNA-binding protein